MFDFGQSLLTMGAEEQEKMLGNATPGQQRAALEMGVGFNNRNRRETRGQARQQKRDGYHDLDRLNHVVEKENEAHDFFGKGLTDWQKGVTGSNPSKDATNLKKQFDDYESSVLSTVPDGGKRHTALAESLPKIKDTFLKQGHQFAVDKLNERSRTVLDKGLQRIAKGALGATDEKGVQAHDDAAFDLINKYVLSEAKFDEKDADAMYDKYLGYAGVEKPKPVEVPTAGEAVGHGDERQAMAAKEKVEEPPAEMPEKSSAQHAREMEEKAVDDRSSGKLAGADNDTHREKSAGTDRNTDPKPWTPDGSVEIARKYLGSADWSVDSEKDNFPSGTNKCNKFVYDALEESGAKVPLINDDRNPFTDEKYPPVATDWEDKEKEIEGWVVVDNPKTGDVASDGKHVGIVSGVETTVSASSREDKVVENDWGFRSGQAGKITFRRYVKE